MSRMSETHRVRGPLRVEVLLVRGLRCDYCGVSLTEREFNIDHFRARSRGGRVRELTNLVVSCVCCNRRKGTRPAADVFGREVAQRVEARLAIRPDDDQRRAARLISAATDSARNTGQLIDLVLDYMIDGRLPAGR